MNIIECLKKHNMTIASSESLTCGLVSKTIADYSGASNYFKGGVASYTKEAKCTLLGLKYSDIEKYGVYSFETAVSMASNIRKILNADIGISTTGVAGPGSDEGVEAGTVYFCIDIKGNLFKFKEKFNGTRNEVRLEATSFLLEKVIYLLENYTFA